MAPAPSDLNENSNIEAGPRVQLGCPGLDNILGGGLPAGRLYLLEGDPGAGKTTLSLQFVAEGVEIVEVLPDEDDLRPEQQYTVFHPAEVELNDRMQRIVKEVRRIKPDRLVLDALSELRMLAKDPLRYRRQILSLKDFMHDQNCTVLLLDDRTSRDADLQLHSIVHGVVSMDKTSREYGKARRQVEILKLRGTPYSEGST